MSNQKTYCDYPSKRIKSPNKNMTLTSLEAVFGMIAATTKEEFIKNYRLAVHDNSGEFTWNLMNKYTKEYRSRELKKKQPKNKKHWFTNGIQNVKREVCPEGFHPGVTGKFRNMYGECGNK